MLIMSSKAMIERLRSGAQSLVVEQRADQLAQNRADVTGERASARAQLIGRLSCAAEAARDAVEGRMIDSCT